MEGCAEDFEVAEVGMRPQAYPGQGRRFYVEVAARSFSTKPSGSCGGDEPMI